MLEVKQAVKTSIAIFQELFPPDTFREPRLEEVNLAEDDNAWRITLSYKNPDLEDDLAAQRAESRTLAGALGGSPSRISTRHFKSITIDANDGSLIGIKSA